MRRLALPAAIVVAAGHMSKGLAKMTSWAGYLPWSWSDPAGVEIARGFSLGTKTTPVSLLPKDAVSAIGILLLMISAWLGAREVQRLSGKSYIADAFPMLALALVYGTIVFGWGL